MEKNTAHEESDPSFVEFEDLFQNDARIPQAENTPHGELKT